MLLVLTCAFLLAACSSGSSSTADQAENSQVDGRGSILAADGTALAETTSASSGKTTRTYPLGAAASSVLGSCYTDGAPDGIEQVYADDLESGADVELTIDPAIQKAAYEALGDNTGSAIVMDPATGAILAMASAPSYDPETEGAVESSKLEQRSTELHIPGSIMKTITLAAALESGSSSLDDQFTAPAELAFEGGSIINLNNMQYPDQTLLQSYAKSINTVFAQLEVKTGFDSVYAMAQHFGFDRELMDDYPLRASMICNADLMDVRMQAWTGVGQALYQTDGELYGPVMSPVHGAAIAAAIVNGGTLVQPYLVERVDGKQRVSERPVVLDSGFMSESTVNDLMAAMRAVVDEGTGSNAAVPGIDVGGKTGTAETISGYDDIWFVGFAQADGKSYALAIMMEGVPSTDAAEAASVLIWALY